MSKAWTLGIVSLLAVVCGINCNGGGDDDDGSSGASNAGAGGDGSGGDGSESGGSSSATGGSSAGGRDAGGSSSGGSGNEGDGGFGGGGSEACGWTYTAGGTLEDAAWSVVALDDHSVIVAGATGSSNHPFGDGGTGAFALRLSPAGQVLWSEVYPDVLGDVFVAHGHSGRIVIAGTAISAEACEDYHGAHDAWVAEISPSTGELLGSACIGGDDDEEAGGVIARGAGENAHYLVTGTVDSDETGNVGPKHGGGGYDSPDVLLGFWTPEGDSASGQCFGSDSPNYGHGFLGSDRVLSSVGEDPGGDYEGLEEFGSGDIAVISLSSSDLCTALPCATALRLGGSGNDSVSVGVDDIMAGSTTSTDGAVGCADEQDTLNSIWIGSYAEGDIVEHSCLSALDNVSVSSLGRGADAVAVVGLVGGLSGDFEDAELVGSVATASETYVATYDDSDLSEPLDIVVVGDSTQFRGAAIREDGCVVAVGTRAVGTFGDVFVYTRPLSP